MDKEIVVKSPTRVDLAGGTLDCWPLFLIVGPSSTINLAINIWTHCRIKPRSDRRVILHSKDLAVSADYADLHACLSDTNPDLSLIREHLSYWQPERGFEMQTESESPVGGGLGGSSSLSISIIKAMSQFCGRTLDWQKMVLVAHNVEARVLKTPTGTQDYIPAIWGGLNVIDYGFEGPQVEKFNPPEEVFSSRLFLVYTGRPHKSGLNNWQVIKSVIDGEKKIIHALEKIRDVAKELKQACAKREWHRLPELFQREYEARIQLTPAFSSPEIEALRDIVLKAGGQAVKICGAGGGGCVFVWTEPGNRERVMEACRKEKFQVLDAKPAPLLL